LVSYLLDAAAVILIISDKSWITEDRSIPARMLHEKTVAM
jgi:hypothetical protein